MSKSSKSLIVDTTALLRHHGIRSARLDTLILLEFTTSVDRSLLLAKSDEVISTDQVKQFEGYVQRRLAGEPIAYITNAAYFYGLKLFVSKDVLVPRPETEQLVDYALSSLTSNAQVLDMGTGSGAISIAIKVNRPDIKVTASDISPSAISVASSNAHKYNIHDIDFIVSDIVDDINTKFDMVIANLPYVQNRLKYKEELAHEPPLALFSGDDGLDHYRRLFAQIQANLKSESKVVLEADPEQINLLRDIASAAGYDYVHTRDFLHVFQQS